MQLEAFAATQYIRIAWSGQSRYCREIAQMFRILILPASSRTVLSIQSNRLFTSSVFCYPRIIISYFTCACNLAESLFSSHSQSVRKENWTIAKRKLYIWEFHEELLENFTFSFRMDLYNDYFTQIPTCLYLAKYLPRDKCSNEYLTIFHF